MNGEARVTDREVINDCVRALEETGQVRVELLRQETGVGARKADGVLKLGGKWGTQNRHFEVKPLLTTQTLPHIRKQLKTRAYRGVLPILLTRYVNPKMAIRLREDELEFVDAAGNMFIHGRGIFLWVTGNRGPRTRPRPTRAFTTTGLKLTFVLLKDQEAANWPYRKLCEAAGVALGNVGWVLGDLEAQGILKRIGPKRRAIRDVNQLREKWETGYAERLRHKLYQGTFGLGKAGPIEELANRVRDAELENRVYIGGDLGAAHLTGVTRPATAAIHTDLGRADLTRGLRIVPERAGNITVFDTFGTMNAGPRADGLALADPLLVRAELLVHGDDRLDEMADRLL